MLSNETGAATQHGTEWTELVIRLLHLFLLCKHNKTLHPNFSPHEPVLIK